MTSRSSLRLTLGVLSLVMPFTAFATAPASVTGVKAQVQNGAVNVTWNAAKETDVTSYRVYFSHASILDNGGSYDDFEPTEGKETTYVLKSKVTSPSLYVAVTAVNSKGEESEYLGDEAMVTLGAASSGGTSAAMLPPPVTSTSSQDSAKALRVVSATASSSTGVTVTFSEPVRISSTDGQRAFVIKNGSGEILPLTRLVVNGNTVVISTLIQTRGIVYTVEVGTVVFGMTNSTTIDLKNRTVTFTGHPKGVPAKPKSAKSGTPASTFVGEVANINLKAEPQADGTYIITVDWRPGMEEADISSYTLRQTRDGGASFSQEQRIPDGKTSARFSKVPSGKFGVLIKTITKTGTSSKGALGSMDLPAFPAETGSRGGTTRRPPSKDPTQLPESGPGTWVLCALAGACMGIVEARRRQKLQEA